MSNLSTAARPTVRFDRKRSADAKQETLRRKQVRRDKYSAIK